MKTILYNPIFINPLAYYVFPRLTRYLQPDNESTSEPANYIGTIEVKVIAYGDTTLKRTYTNTDSIDLSEFKNTWIRISLFTKVGSCVLGEWKIGNMESDLPYIDPEVLASLKAVVIVGNKTNNDSDRAIVKNLVDPDNPFVISNAAYTEGSGYADKGSPYYGAFVTDGIDDLITSTKTAVEMGITNEVTVVSMIHQIGGINSSAVNYGYTNYFRGINQSTLRNNATGLNKTGIYGYSATNYTPTVINNILGDKNDYVTNSAGFSEHTYGNVFSVEGYKVSNTIAETSQVAWYWTIIANKVLTTDQINQVIAYFNLDRTLNPDILCNTIKQGITNENHAEFGDKLIDFSGNGRDIQLNNIAWKGDSGIGRYETELSNTSIWTQSKETTSSPFSSSYNGLSGWIVFANTELTNSADMPSFKIQVKGLLEGQELIYRYYDSTGQSNVYSMDKDGEYTLPSDVRTAKPQISNTSGFQVVKNEANIITITQIPSHAGALCLDGVNDFGQFVGDLGLKDYTLIMNRAYNNLINNQVPLVSSNIVEDQTPFIVEHWNTGSNAISFSYGASRTTDIPLDINKKIVYQSTYSYMGYVIPKGNAISTGGGITLGKFGNGVQYSAICLWSLMLFPYSMSEFLIERQLKKHKLGTLYPDMVEFRPVIKANANYNIFYTALLPLTGIVWEKINIGDYIPVGRRVAIQLSFDNEASELVSAISSQLGNISITKNSNNKGYTIFGDILKNKSPQKINITIDEYIRYEDIVQPYPSFVKLENLDRTYTYTWGDKLKVGDTIRYNSSKNLLEGAYTLRGQMECNGVYVFDNNQQIVVTKEMVFAWSHSPIWNIDDNEPKCILSPRLLRIPNASYKILGYIPDISGHGNHGVIHNSAYAEGSGVNEDGSYQFDGVDDFVAIPTLSSGGKQVLMKVNWQSSIAQAMLYDQRGTAFAIWNSDKFNDDEVDTTPAYSARNGGNTYIDGILNKNILASQLRNITHNIVATNNMVNGNSVSPSIGCTLSNSYYSQMALYDFMLFDEISTDDKIKELNEYVGIEAKVELPPYYWDAYGKTNLDEDKATIQQRGVAIGDYDLINNNFAYEGMSGYNGYPAVFGTNKTYANLVPNDGNFILTSSHNIINVTKFDTSYGLLYSHIKLDGKLTSRNIDYPSYKIKVTGLGENFGLHYSYLESSSDTTVKGFEINNDGIYIIPKSFASDGSLTSNSDWIGFIFTGTAPESCNVTIEVLPEYENGLVYDGVTDYSENANIPAFTDYTYIFKRTLLNKKYNSASVFKGSNQQSGGGAFICDYNSVEPELMIQGYSFGAGLYANSLNTNDIVYGTKNSVNGAIISPGNNADVEGLAVGKWRAYRQMVFYKLILYPKTISLLLINFLKNLMERDEIIDLTNPIFIQE